MWLYELFDRAGLECPENVENLEILNIVTDSRRVRRGSLFICIRGGRSDGHDYIDDAIKAGASVIVVEQVRDACVGGAAAFIMLDNTRRVAALLYNSWYGGPAEKLKIIGVTGTNGKTSVTTMLYEIFSGLGLRSGLIGTVRCLSAGCRPLSLKSGDTEANMTTPDPEQLYKALDVMVRDGVEYVFMEVSSHALSLCKVDAITFDCAVFTNLSRDHLDFHGTMDEYYRAKSTLLSRSRRAIINIDGEYGKRLADECPCPFFTLSERDGDFCALDVRTFGVAGSEYRLRSPLGEGNINIPLAGDFFVTNSLMAASLALLYGLPLDGIARILSNTRGVKGRMEKVELPTDEFSVIIDYAHTPDALEKLLKSVFRIKAPYGHIILIFGCGGERDREKRREMAQIASRFSDLVIVTSDNCRGEDPKQIFSDILKGIDKERPYCLIEDRAVAIESAVISAGYGDIIVLAGKGHERYEINADGKRPFDETKIVKAAFRKRS